MDDINKIIGKNLLQLRKNAKLTQMELADIFNYSDKSISKWETGESLPSIETLYDICVFYGVTLDSLTKEETPVPQEEQKPKRNLLPARLIITLLAVSAVWLLATILFVSFKISLNKNIAMFFLWAVPISFVVLLVFNSIWGKKYLLFAILTGLIWSTLACIHVQLLKYNLWMIYLLGIPLQVAVILWAALLKKPRKQKKAGEKAKKHDDVAQQNAAKKAEIKQKRELKKNKKSQSNAPVAEKENLPSVEQKPLDAGGVTNDDELKIKNKPSKKAKDKDSDDFGYDFIQNKKS